MRENIPEKGMVDVQWLRNPSKSHKRIPEHIERRFPIVNSEKLIEAFVKLNRKPVTLIACPNVAEAAVAIPFLVGVISAGNAENFKMILAQKQFTQYTMDMLNELIISSEDEPAPVKLRGREKNLMIKTFSKAYNLIEGTMDLSESHLTYLVIEGFDGDQCLDLELLFLAIQLTEKQKSEELRVIVLTDGLVHESRSRVEKLCDGIVSLQFVNLISTEKKRPNRDVIVVDSTTSGIIQVNEQVYERLDKSMVSEVYLEREDPLSANKVMESIRKTVALIKHFVDEEINRGKGSPFIYVVFTPSIKVLRKLVSEIKDITMNTDIEIFTVRSNGDIKYAQEIKGKCIVLVSDVAEDAFVLDNINIVFDMGLTSWKSNVTSIGSNTVKTMWADRVRMIRRANFIERGTVAYPFNKDQLQWIRTRSISKHSGFDLDMRYFYDSKRWSYMLNEERTNIFMKRAEDIYIRSGLISYRDPRYSTPIGSFCSSVLPMLPPRLAKLVLCGIVCGCEDAAIALATILTEETLVIECSWKLHSLMKYVKVGVRSEHLALLHTFDRRYSPSGLHTSNYKQVKSMDMREQLIRTRIKKGNERVSLSSFVEDEEMEKRMLLTLAMAFGDRIGYAPIGDENGETRHFQLEDPDIGEKTFTFDTKTKFPASEERAGIYYEMREKEKYSAWTTEVTMLPVTILAAIGNIGGRAERSTEGLSLTTNTGALNIIVSECEEAEEMMDIRNEVRMEVERVALSYLQSDRYIHHFKTDRDKWMHQLIPLLVSLPSYY